MHARAANDLPTELAAETTAMLAWWREAGVDYLFADTPSQWLLSPEAAAADSAPGPAFPAMNASPLAPVLPRAMIGGDRSRWPGELANFAAWWLSEPSLDQGQLRGRVPPRGPGDAALMVLVAQPEAEDGETLLAGPQGKLLGAMLAAMGMPAEHVYVASALPRHTPMADWGDLTAQGLGDVVRHHIALARPQRAIAFGRHVSTLLNSSELALPREVNGSAQNVQSLANINHDGAKVPLLAARDLGSLLERPVGKGAFWQQWLEWSPDAQAHSG